MTKDAGLELSIVIPCLNEARTVGTCVRKARDFLVRRGIAGEVIVADNGSTDDSEALARAAGATVVAVATPGYGAAIIGGIEAARGRFVIMGDADDSYDFAALDVFVDRLRAGHDLVMGNRFLGGIAAGAMPWHHKYVGNPVLSTVGRLFFASPVRDFHCGLRGFKRDAVLALGLSSHGMEFASEMVVKATLAKLDITEVPTTLSKDGRNRAPHLRSFRDGWRHLRFLLLHSPQWLFFYPGIALFVLGWIGQALLAMGPLRLGHVVLDIHSLLYAGAASVLGLQLVVFSVLAHLLAIQKGLLPELPAYLAWVEEISLEMVLVVGVVSFVAGAFITIWAVSGWALTGFRGLDPTQVMRAAIPASTLLTSGAEVSFAAFMLSLVRIDAKRDR